MKYFVGRYSQTPRSEGSAATFLKAAKSEPLTTQNIPSGLFWKNNITKKEKNHLPHPTPKFRLFNFSKWKSFFKRIGVCVF